MTAAPLDTSSRKSGISVTKSLVLAFSNKAAFMGRYLPELGGGGLFLPGMSQLSVGDQVCIDTTFIKEGIAMQLLSLVRWRRYRGQAELPTGIGAEFIGATRDFDSVLRDLTPGNLEASLAPRARRVHAAIKLLTISSGRMCRGVTRDLSRSGVFVVTSEMSVGGPELFVRLLPAGEENVEAPCRIVRRTREGIGLQLVGPSAAWAQLCERVQLMATSGSS